MVRTTDSIQNIAASVRKIATKYYILCFQKKQIADRYKYLTSTGRNGYMTQTDRYILEVAKESKEICGNLTASSVKGFQLRGNSYNNYKIWLIILQNTI